MTLNAPILIPSRLLKRMLTIFLTQSGIPDPFREKKREMNRRAAAFLESPFFSRLVNVCPEESLGCISITGLRFELDLLEMERLLFFSTHKPFWTHDDAVQGLDAAEEIEVPLGVVLQIGQAAVKESERVRPVRRGRAGPRRTRLPGARGARLAERRFGERPGSQRDCASVRGGARVRGDTRVRAADARRGVQECGDLHLGDHTGIEYARLGRRLAHGQCAHAEPVGVRGYGAAPGQQVVGEQAPRAHAEAQQIDTGR